METMKQTGVQWIGEIPSTWDLIRTKHFSYMKGRIGWQGLTADEFIEEGPYLVTGTDFENGRVCWERSYHISEKRYDEAPQIQLTVGDLLVTKDGTIGKLAYIDQLPGKASLNSHLLVMRPLKNKYINRFLYWMLSSSVFIEYYTTASNGSTMDSLSQEKMGDFVFPTPPIEEQEAIADFLDEHCGKLDGIIADLEKQIETLKSYRKSIITETMTKGLDKNALMKDSGVDWIGNIPQHWGLNKIRYVTTIRTEKSFFDHNKDIYVGLENIESSTGKYIETESEYEDGIYDVFRSGDVMFGKLRPYLAKTLMPDFSGFCTGELCIFKKSTLNMRYLFYYMFHDGYLKMVNSSTYGTKMPRTSWDYIKNLCIPIPPKSEQDSICYYLDETCMLLDELIQSKQSQVAKMRSHQAALIFEYVTGKKRVKEVQ